MDYKEREAIKSLIININLLKPTALNRPKNGLDTYIFYFEQKGRRSGKKVTYSVAFF